MTPGDAHAGISGYQVCCCQLDSLANLRPMDRLIESSSIACC